MAEATNPITDSAFGIITHVGAARSSYVQAIRAASEHDFDLAESLMREGKAEYVAGHRYHARLLAKMAAGEQVVVDLLLAHAEDQLMAAEQFKLVADAFIALHQRLERLEATQVLESG